MAAVALFRFCRAGPVVTFAREAKPLLLVNPLRKFCAAETESLSSQKLEISDSCVKQLQKVCGNDEALRVFVESGGCSGFQYKFELDNDVTEEDHVFEKEGVKVIVDKESLAFLNGALIEYTSELIRSAFQITNNPNAGKGCSCGVSFSVNL